MDKPTGEGNMSHLVAAMQRYLSPAGVALLTSEWLDLRRRGHSMTINWNEKRHKFRLTLWSRGRSRFTASARTKEELASLVDGYYATLSAPMAEAFEKLLLHLWLLEPKVHFSKKVPSAIQQILERISARKRAGSQGVRLRVFENRGADISLLFGHFNYLVESNRLSDMTEVLLTPTWVMSEAELATYRVLLGLEIERISWLNGHEELLDELVKADCILMQLSRKTSSATQTVRIEFASVNILDSITVALGTEHLKVAWELVGDVGETTFYGPDANVRAYYFAKRKLKQGGKNGSVRLENLDSSIATALISAHFESYLIQG